MIKELTRFEIADIKVVAQRTSTLRRKRESVYKKILELNDELEEIDENILRWEKPILQTTEGMYSVDALKHIKDGKLYVDEPENTTEEAPTPTEENIPGDIVNNNASAEQTNDYQPEEAPHCDGDSCEF